MCYIKFKFKKDTPEVKEKPAEKEKVLHIQPKGTMCYTVSQFFYMW